jgi:hypothetical protein
MSSNSLALTDLEADLLTRVRADGGFSHQRGESYRADATAWAVIALSSTVADRKYIQPAITRLMANQLGDGSISISPDHTDAFWPTPLAILACHCASVNGASQRKAIQFMLSTTGKHWEKRPEEIAQHNTALKGWPWIAATHSWVEPTALGTIALTMAGYQLHPRVKEAIHMLVDRQLPHGGWNYGNTSVFGQELRAAPESTGAALHALTGYVPQQDVQLSLDYLSTEVTRLRTPIALGWSLLALNSWGIPIPNMTSLIADCLKRQERYGRYDTTSLCLLILPLVSPNGLLANPTTAI